MSKYPNVAKAEKYARDVVAGKIVANKWIKLACQRHIDDKAKAKNKDSNEIIYLCILLLFLLLL